VTATWRVERTDLLPNLPSSTMRRVGIGRFHHKLGRHISVQNFIGTWFD
jgi:hypothetical protein